MPALDSWTNPDIAEPITNVLPMGSLQNTIRSFDSGRPAAIGVIGVADAICHTDPVLALGLSFSLIHGRALAAAVCESSDVFEAALAFDARTRADMEERFAYASAIDDARLRRWSGEAVDFGRRDGGAYALFTYMAGMAAALLDGDVFRAVVRRNTFLDSLSVVDEDTAMQERIERVYAEMVAAGRPRPGPSRDELLEVIERAVAA
jgi:hypothetical protein